MTYETLFEGCPKFVDSKGNTYFYANRVCASGRLLVWDMPVKKDGTDSTCLHELDPASCSEETLKGLDVWDKISDDRRKTVLQKDDQARQMQEVKKTEVHERMEKARQGRRTKYPGLPKDLTCCKCKDVMAIAPSLLAQRIEKAKVLTCDYLKAWTCQKCNPTKGNRKGGKGRPANPALAHVPTELVCKCGAKVTYPKTLMLQRIEKSGKSQADFVATYQCQKCHPTKGRKKAS